MPFVTKVRKSIASRAGKAASRLMQVKYGSCAVLLYHRVADLETDPQQLAVTPENFESHLRILKEDYHLLTVKQFREHLQQAKPFPERSVLLTFDDGYADNYFEALPLLEKQKAESIFYICTGNLDTAKEFWWDELERLLLCGSFPNILELTLDSKTFTASQDLTSRQSMYEALLPVLRQKNYSTREDIFREIRNKIPDSPRPSHRSMTSDELKKLSESNSVTIGAHTVHHCSLGSLTEQEQKQEIADSISKVELITGKKVEDFSYPFGTFRDFNKHTVEICRSQQMKWVAANIPGCVHAKSNPYSFPRFLVRDWKDDDFRMHLNSFYKK